MKKPTRAELRKFYRELEQWDLQTVATAAGLHTSTLYYWLSESTENPRVENLKRVADVIGYRFPKTK